MLKKQGLAKYPYLTSTSRTGGAGYIFGVSRRQCLIRTRILRSGKDRKLGSPLDMCVYWLNGVAGSGKTAIAQNFPSVCLQRDSLASFSVRGSFLNKEVFTLSFLP